MSHLGVRLGRIVARLAGGAAGPPLLPARRLVVVDPGLRGVAGHHLAYDLALAAQAKRLGLRLRLLGNSLIDRGALPPDLRVERVFRDVPYQGRGPVADPDARARRRSERFHRQLAQALGDPGPGDIVVLHTPNATMTAGAAAWIARVAERAAARFVVLFVLPDHRCAARATRPATGRPSSSWRACRSDACASWPATRIWRASCRRWPADAWPSAWRRT